MAGVDSVITLDEIGNIVSPLVKPYPVKRVIIFGSYARGENEFDSDVDLIIDSDGQLSDFDFFGIIGDIVKAMPIKVDVFELDEIKKPSKMFDSIINDGRIIYEA